MKYTILILPKRRKNIKESRWSEEEKNFEEIEIFYYFNFSKKSDFHFVQSLIVVSHQCDKIGLLLKGLWKVGQIFSSFWAIWKNKIFFVKANQPNFWATDGNFGLLFITISGHAVSHSFIHSFIQSYSFKLLRTQEKSLLWLYRKR